ncbi:MAG: aspartate-semialdehyde dehydrogenase [Bdellovibrio sp.]|nr:MAG: aspartate-semialdehyde dehydrogenase [Bdellovibrio sp.]
MKIGVVGATGLVGQTFLQILEQRSVGGAAATGVSSADATGFDLALFASENSVGKTMSFRGKSYPVHALSKGCFNGLELVFFSSGDPISQEWAPQAAQAGAWAVDNSAAFRMDDRYPLIVPEVNGDLLSRQKTPTIIANPNCSTIQLVVALNPLLKNLGLESVKVASYQSVSGAGQAGVDELDSQIAAYAGALSRSESNPQHSLKAKAFPHPILSSCIPQIGSLQEGGYYSEEIKVIRESKKILRSPRLRVSAMTVRVPVRASHAEAVWVTLNKEVSREEVVATLAAAPGLVVQDDPAKSIYPLQGRAAGEDPVFVGRIHRDVEDPFTWLFWVVSDNVRKGAALNGVQIAELIFGSPLF